MSNVEEHNPSGTDDLGHEVTSPADIQEEAAEQAEEHPLVHPGDEPEPKAEEGQLRPGVDYIPTPESTEK